MKHVRVRDLVAGNYKILLLSILLSVAVLDALVISQRPLDPSDGVSSTWWMIIKNVQAGSGYKACEAAYIPNCGQTDQITAMREPLPVFLFVFVGRMAKNQPLAIQLTQLVLNVLICLFVFLLAREIANPVLGLAAAGIWAVYLPILHAIPTVNGDLLATLFVVSGLLVFIRAVKGGKAAHWMMLGLLLGLASLSRSSASLIFVMLILGSTICLWKTHGLSASGTWYSPLLAVVVFALVISPWVIRNERVFGKPIWGTTLIGYNLYRHNAFLVNNVPPHYVGPSEAYAEVEKLVARVPELRTPIDEAQVDTIFRREAGKIISSHFAQYLKLAGFRLLPLLFNIGVRDQYGDKMSILDYLEAVQQLLLLIASLIAIWKGDWRIRLVALCAFVFMFAYLAVGSQLRYLLPVMPLIVTMSTIGVHSVFRLRVTK